MKKTCKIVLLVTLLVFLIPAPVLADDDYVTPVVQGLQESPIYLHPDIEDTNNEIKAGLTNILWDGDYIVLIMLPEEASETDINVLVKSISHELENQYVIGLAVGKEVVGHAPMLPLGIDADQMRRANSVSNDPATALITFVQNIHKWQNSNPEPTRQPTQTPVPTPKPPLTETQKKRRFWIIGIPIGVLVVCIVVVIFRTRAKYVLSERHKSLLLTLDEIENLKVKVDGITDDAVRSELIKACKVALGLLELLQDSDGPQGYVEEKFPELINNMRLQIKSFVGHESGRFPLKIDTLVQLREVLINYDDLFIKLQNNNPQAEELLASIINSNNAMITTLGYIPDKNK